MRLTFTFLLVFIFSSFSHAQKLTGIWRGYFVQQDFNPLSGQFVEDKYKYEVQINQLSNNALEGVTYSYKTTVFYGKASIHGIFKAETKNILLKEIKMLDLKISGQSVACLMTCYLDYSKSGKVEMLSGSYTSQNLEQKTDCGSGSIYLEKVKTTDFEKEPFLLKKANSKTGSTTSKKDSLSNKPPTNTIEKKPSTSANTKAVPAKPAAKPNSITSKPAVKPGAEAFIVPKKQTIKKDSVIAQKITPIAADTTRKQERPITKTILAPVPKVLKERSNSLVRTIEIDEKQVQIDYYDNGEIDNDTITVYHNNELAINHGRLSYTPITLKIQLDEAHPIHEIITVAENLGDIPPNTALMVITTPSRKRYEVFITSDEKTNAKVILEYKPKDAIKVH